MIRSVLVTGGAGYIGSHTARQLVDAGYDVVVLDNLYSGNQWAIPQKAEFYQGDILNEALLTEIFNNHSIDSVVHLADHIVVPESVSNPGKYYKNNVVGSLKLIQSCIDHHVNHFVFSSSAAVYGIPQHIPVTEQAPLAPINPYGTTKLVTEWMLRDFAQAHSQTFRYVALRYFNVAGAHMSGELGQATPEATHLIKVACETAIGKRAKMVIYGDDYPTLDGTCVRDYIHVEDLATAHLHAIDYLRAGGENVVLNCGYGKGHSVQQVINCMRQVSGRPFKVVPVGRRAGDPPALVAENTLLLKTLPWKPKYDDLSLICRSAYQWEIGL